MPRKCGASYCNIKSKLKSDIALLSYAVNIILALAINIGFNQAMDIRFKSRELLIEVSSKIEIVNDAFIEALTRN